MGSGEGSDSPALIGQFVDEGLGNSSYLVASRADRVAAVIDPLRDVTVYEEAARRNGLKITHVLDTHLHADFVSGARELAARTGARILASAEAGVRFDHRPLGGGDRVRLGDLELEVLRTPGHSPEHVAFLLAQPEDVRPLALFSGGALIVGGAARTDLLGEAEARPLARELYRTIHGTLMALPDDLPVYPTHGAGSFCSTPGGGSRTTTIGRERRGNPLARPQTEEEFVTRVLTGLPSYPLYFRELRAVNREGPRVLGGLPHLAPLTAEEVRAWVSSGGIVVDVRSAKAFAAGHVPEAYSIGTDVWITTWAGWLLPFGAPLVLIADEREDLEDAVRQLVCIGYDDLRGALAGGMAAWVEAGLAVDRVASLDPEELRDRLDRGDLAVLDVRFNSEWDAGRIPGAVHLENGRTPYEDPLPFGPRQSVAVYCGHGGRSMTGISVLARRGCGPLYQLAGGFFAWEASGFAVER